MPKILGLEKFWTSFSEAQKQVTGRFSDHWLVDWDAFYFLGLHEDVAYFEALSYQSKYSLPELYSIQIKADGGLISLKLN